MDEQKQGFGSTADDAVASSAARVKNTYNITIVNFDDADDRLRYERHVLGDPNLSLEDALSTSNETQVDAHAWTIVLGNLIETHLGLAPDEYHLDVTGHAEVVE